MRAGTLALLLSISALSSSGCPRPTADTAEATPSAAPSPAPSPDASPAAAALPEEVAKFVERWEACWHWSGEEPYNDARAKEIEAGAAASCPGNEERRTELLRRHAGNEDAVKALQALDQMR